MTLDEEIEWWTRKSREKTKAAGLVCFGVATGLKLAKRDYGAAQETPAPKSADGQSTEEK